MTDWVIVRCDPTTTVEDFDGEWAGDAWVPQQKSRTAGGKPVVENVMQGIMFVPREQWPSFRRTAPRRYKIEAYEHKGTGQPRTMKDEDVKAMIVALSRSPMPNPMKSGDTIMCSLGPWAGKGGTLIKLTTPRTVRVQFGTEYATIPKVFIKRT